MRVKMSRAGMFGGGSEVRKRAIKREHSVRMVDCRVAVTTGGTIPMAWEIEMEQRRRPGDLGAAKFWCWHRVEYLHPWQAYRK